MPVADVPANVVTVTSTVPTASGGEVTEIGSAFLAMAIGLAVVQLPPIVDHFIDPFRVWVIAGLAGFGQALMTLTSPPTGARGVSDYCRQRRMSRTGLFCGPAENS